MHSAILVWFTSLLYFKGNITKNLTFYFIKCFLWRICSTESIPVFSNNNHRKKTQHFSWAIRTRIDYPGGWRAATGPRVPCSSQHRLRRLPPVHRRRDARRVAVSVRAASQRRDWIPDDNFWEPLQNHIWDAAEGCSGIRSDYCYSGR